MAKVEFIIIDDPLKDGLKPSKEALEKFKKEYLIGNKERTQYLTDLNKAYEITKQSNTIEFGDLNDTAKTESN